MMPRIVQTPITVCDCTVGSVSGSMVGKVNIKVLGTIGTGAGSMLNFYYEFGSPFITIMFAVIVV